MSTLNVDKQNDEGKTVFTMEGRLDTNTSPDFQTTLIDEFETAQDVTLDCEKLAYVSSAGLRVLLAGQKKANAKGAAFHLVHVSDNVKEVLDMIGFLDFIEVE